MSKVAVVTGAGAGVGRATVEEFARRGYHVALLSRDRARIDRAVADLQASYDVRALGILTDVADADAVEAAASHIDQELGSIEVWINVAGATVFASVSELTAREFERGVKVTYRGQMHGTMAALARMRASNRGTIVNVGSALGYWSVPLQSICCGAKFAVRGFTDALRSKIIRDRLDVHLTMVDLPAITPPVRLGSERDGNKSAADWVGLPARSGRPMNVAPKTTMIKPIVNARLRQGTYIASGNCFLHAVCIQKPAENYESADLFRIPMNGGTLKAFQ
ncbi:Putative oxidoreductase SadH (plasmid) [Burkholderia sp. AD24]|nr:Putative oxidoreductase SadH [Burkholderia sp. AD24]